MIKKITLNNGLYIVSTPIGNLGDISYRAVRVLESSNFILCENPLHSRKLLNEYGIKKKLVSVHDYSESRVIKKIYPNLLNNIVALISDSGSPLISDPGYKIVDHCIKNNIYVTSIPGPSSIISSLQLSGVSNNMFSFNGFVPKKERQAKDLFDSIKERLGAQIFFSSSHRFEKNISLMFKFFKNRKISICRELTKLNEEIIRTDLERLSLMLLKKEIKIKGEFVIIIEGKNKGKSDITIKEIVGTLEKLNKKFSLTDAVKIVHNLTGLSKKEIYSAGISKKRKSD